MLVLGDGRFQEELRADATGGRLFNSGNEASDEQQLLPPPLRPDADAAVEVDPVAAASTCDLPDHCSRGPRGLIERRARSPAIAAREPKPFPRGAGRRGGEGSNGPSDLCTKDISVTLRSDGVS